MNHNIRCCSCCRRRRYRVTPAFPSNGVFKGESAFRVRIVRLPPPYSTREASSLMQRMMINGSAQRRAPSPIPNQHRPRLCLRTSPLSRSPAVLRPLFCASFAASRPAQHNVAVTGRVLRRLRLRSRRALPLSFVVRSCSCSRFWSHSPSLYDLLRYSTLLLPANSAQLATPALTRRPNVAHEPTLLVQTLRLPPTERSAGQEPIDSSASS